MYVLVTDASGQVKFWHYQTGRCLNTTYETRQCLCSGFNSTGERYAVGGEDPAINIYDTITKKKIITCEPR